MSSPYIHIVPNIKCNRYKMTKQQICQSQIIVQVRRHSGQLCAGPPTTQWSNVKHCTNCETALTYLIFVTKFTCETCGEKFVMWRNFWFLYTTNGEKSEKCSGISDFSTWKMWRIVKSWQLWRNFLFLHMTYVKNWNLPCFVAKSVG